MQIKEVITTINEMQVAGVIDDGQPKTAPRGPGEEERFYHIRRAP